MYIIIRELEDIDICTLSVLVYIISNMCVVNFLHMTHVIFVHTVCILYAYLVLRSTVQVYERDSTPALPVVVCHMSDVKQEFPGRSAAFNPACQTGFLCSYGILEYRTNFRPDPKSTSASRN